MSTMTTEAASTTALRRLRTEAGWPSRRALARVLGVSRETVRHWERELHRPYAAAGARLEAALGSRWSRLPGDDERRGVGARSPPSRRVMVNVADARKAKALASLPAKTEKLDARFAGPSWPDATWVPKVWVPSLGDRELKERLGRRMHLVWLRTSAINRAHGVLTQFGIRLAFDRLRQPDGLALLERRGVLEVCRRSVMTGPRRAAWRICAEKWGARPTVDLLPLVMARSSNLSMPWGGMGRAQTRRRRRAHEALKRCLRPWGCTRSSSSVGTGSPFLPPPSGTPRGWRTADRVYASASKAAMGWLSRR
jgi:transcriptional regulator with XRE-family HTH domain